MRSNQIKQGKRATKVLGIYLDQSAVSSDIRDIPGTWVLYYLK